MCPLFLVIIAIALLVSAWIEIPKKRLLDRFVEIALLVSAWIEILPLFRTGIELLHRTPCECVD